VIEAPKTTTTTTITTPHPPETDAFPHGVASAVPPAPADVLTGTAGTPSLALPHSATADSESAPD